ncbi:MAG: hypothetical protein JEZ07_14030 [Phycisphaerae bacterium]|nr:hypothetical protein [Phycisphaerae bacterium]
MKTRLFLWFCAVMVNMAQGHPISFSKADANVCKDKVTLHVSVLCEDYFLFYGLSPNDQNMLQAEEISVATEGHKSFLLKYISVLDKQGNKLTGYVAKVQPFDVPAEGVSVDDMSKSRYSTDYILQYDLDEPVDFLTFSQNFGGEEAFVPSVMELTIRQEGVEIDYVSQLGCGQAHILSFDWSAPPIPLTAQQRLARQQKRSQQQAAMGISSYVSIYSFIYIERFEIRHEVLIPFLTLESFIPVKRKDNNFLDIQEQDAAKEKIAEFFTIRNPVYIDGIKVKGVVSRVDFYGLDFKDFAMMAPRQRLSVMNARVGVIISYYTKGYPGQLDMDWELFNPNVPVLRSTIFTNDKTDKFVFSRFRRQFHWSDPGLEKLPALGMVPSPLPVPKLFVSWLSVCFSTVMVLVLFLWLKNGMKRGGMATIIVLLLLSLISWGHCRIEIDNPLRGDYEISQIQSSVVFETLHKNIYRAFDYRAEGDIYDALAHSVGGDLLPELYLIIHKGRLMTEQGGAASRINEVSILDGKMLDCFYNEQGRATFTYRASWTVDGTVEHWAHIHERTHQYEADFVLQALNGSWRITDFEMLDEKRLKYRTRLRQF